MSAKPRPADPCCGLGYSPADPRQSQAEGKVCAHADRLLNMVHAYCQIRDSWTGWVRGRSIWNTLQRIVAEMRALRQAEERVVDKLSVTLLAVLDYAACARVPLQHASARTASSPHPQPPHARGVADTSPRYSRDRAGAMLRWRLNNSLADSIDAQMDEWRMTGSEKDVAWLIIKGYRFAEIAEARGVKENTTRLQATSVYAKAGVSGRAEFVAEIIQSLLLLLPDAKHASR